MTEIVDLPPEVQSYLQDNPSVQLISVKDVTLTSVKDNVVVSNSFNTTETSIQGKELAAIALAALAGAVVGAAVGAVAAKLLSSSDSEDGTSD